MRATFNAVLTLLFIVVIPAASQGVDLSITTSGGAVIAVDTLIAVGDSDITVVSHGWRPTLALDSVVGATSRNGGHFWSGAKYGAVTGFAVGAILGANETFASDWFGWKFGQKGGATLDGITAGVIGGFVIGGIVGAAVPDFARQDLSRVSRQEKREYFEEILRDKP